MADGAPATTPPDDPVNRPPNRTVPTQRVTHPSRLTPPAGNAEAVPANGGPAGQSLGAADAANFRDPADVVDLSGPGGAADLPDSARRTDSARPTGIGGRRFRSILGRFATGVVAVTAVDPETGRPTGLAANSFASVSLEPPLVSFCVAHTSTTWPKLRKAGRFCVNVLSRPQRDVCLRLATKGADKFAGLSWSTSPAGGPVIDGALAWLDCSIEAEYVAGDHVIVVSRVHELDRHHDGEPLVFFRGAYGGFGE
jgi:3-hydroxy-9,10-secoandrosta-1,3,5(10)-triene-9,17-dione monooxygenase reductase component